MSLFESLEYTFGLLFVGGRVKGFQFGRKFLKHCCHSKRRKALEGSQDRVKFDITKSIDNYGMVHLPLQWPEPKVASIVAGELDNPVTGFRIHYPLS